MAKYFTMSEMTFSDTAYKYNIDNIPSPEIEKNLNELMEVLDDLRSKWGGPIRVTSGYRCPEVNKLVGGSKTSAHLTGFAADLKPYNNQMDAFNKFVIEWSKDKEFDQIIEERNSSGGRWLHFGYKNAKGQQRRQIKNIYVK